MSIEIPTQGMAPVDPVDCGFNPFLTPMLLVPVPFPVPVIVPLLLRPQAVNENEITDRFKHDNGNEEETQCQTVGGEDRDLYMTADEGESDEETISEEDDDLTRVKKRIKKKGKIKQQQQSLSQILDDDETLIKAPIPSRIFGVPQSQPDSLLAPENHLDTLNLRDDDKVSRSDGGNNPINLRDEREAPKFDIAELWQGAEGDVYKHLGDSGLPSASPDQRAEEVPELEETDTTGPGCVCEGIEGLSGVVGSLRGEHGLTERHPEPAHSRENTQEANIAHNAAAHTIQPQNSQAIQSRPNDILQQPSKQLATNRRNEDLMPSESDTGASRDAGNTNADTLWGMMMNPQPSEPQHRVHSNHVPASSDNLQHSSLPKSHLRNASKHKVVDKKHPDSSSESDKGAKDADKANPDTLWDIINSQTSTQRVLSSIPEVKYTEDSKSSESKTESIDTSSDVLNRTEHTFTGQTSDHSVTSNGQNSDLDRDMEAIFSDLNRSYNSETTKTMSGNSFSSKKSLESDESGNEISDDIQIKELEVTQSGSWMTINEDVVVSAEAIDQSLPGTSDISLVNGVHSSRAYYVPDSSSEVNVVEGSRHTQFTERRLHPGHNMANAWKSKGIGTASSESEFSEGDRRHRLLKTSSRVQGSPDLTEDCEGDDFVTSTGHYSNPLATPPVEHNNTNVTNHDPPVQLGNTFKSRAAGTASEGESDLNTQSGLYDRNQGHRQAPHTPVGNGRDHVGASSQTLPSETQAGPAFHSSLWQQEGEEGRGRVGGSQRGHQPPPPERAEDEWSEEEEEEEEEREEGARQYGGQQGGSPVTGRPDGSKKKASKHRQSPARSVPSSHAPETPTLNFETDHQRQEVPRNSDPPETNTNEILFVYHREAEMWTERNLVNRLLEMRASIRIHLVHRLFSGGQTKEELAVDNLKKCNHVVLVLSRSFQNCDLCSYILSYVLNSFKDKMLIVKAETCDAPSIIGHLQILTLDSPNFWRNLVTGIDERLEQTTEDWKQPWMYRGQDPFLMLKSRPSNPVHPHLQQHISLPSTPDKRVDHRLVFLVNLGGREGVRPYDRSHNCRECPTYRIRYGEIRVLRYLRDSQIPVIERDVERCVKLWEDKFRQPTSQEALDHEIAFWVRLQNPASVHKIKVYIDFELQMKEPYSNEPRTVHCQTVDLETKPLKPKQSKKHAVSRRPGNQGDEEFGDSDIYYAGRNLSANRNNNSAGTNGGFSGAGSQASGHRASGFHPPPMASHSSAPPGRMGSSASRHQSSSFHPPPASSPLSAPPGGAGSSNSGHGATGLNSRPAAPPGRVGVQESGEDQSLIYDLNGMNLAQRDQRMAANGESRGSMPGGSMPGGSVPGGSMPGGSVPGGSMPGGRWPGDGSLQEGAEATEGVEGYIYTPGVSGRGGGARPKTQRPNNLIGELFAGIFNNNGVKPKPSNPYYENGNRTKKKSKKTHRKFHGSPSRDSPDAQPAPDVPRLQFAPVVSVPLPPVAPRQGAPVVVTQEELDAIEEAEREERLRGEEAMMYREQEWQQVPLTQKRMELGMCTTSRGNLFTKKKYQDLVFNLEQLGEKAKDPEKYRQFMDTADMYLNSLSTKLRTDEKIIVTLKKCGVEHYLNNLKQASAHVREALELLPHAKYQHQLEARTYYYISTIYREKKKFGKAKHWIKKAKDCLQHVEKGEDSAKTFYNEGRLYMRMLTNTTKNETYRIQAIDCFKNAMEHAQYQFDQYGTRLDVKLVRRCLLNMARILVDLPETEVGMNRNIVTHENLIDAEECIRQIKQPKYHHNISQRNHVQLHLAEAGLSFRRARMFYQMNQVPRAETLIVDAILKTTTAQQMAQKERFKEGKIAQAFMKTLTSEKIYVAGNSATNWQVQRNKLESHTSSSDITTDGPGGRSTRVYRGPSDLSDSGGPTSSAQSDVH